MSDLLESCKSLVRLDEDNALVPHGLGGHGRSCLKWSIEEIERLRAFVADIAGAKIDLHGADARNALQTIQKQAKEALRQPS